MLSISQAAYEDLQKISASYQNEGERSLYIESCIKKLESLFEKFVREYPKSLSSLPTIIDMPLKNIRRTYINEHSDFFAINVDDILVVFQTKKKSLRRKPDINIVSLKKGDIVII